MIAEGCLHINYYNISGFKGSNFSDPTPLVTRPGIRLLMLLSRFLQASKCSLKLMWYAGGVMVWYDTVVQSYTALNAGESCTQCACLYVTLCNFILLYRTISLLLPYTTLVWENPNTDCMWRNRALTQGNWKWYKVQLPPILYNFILMHSILNPSPSALYRTLPTSLSSVTTWVTVH
jgi:hypothetical protein